MSSFLMFNRVYRPDIQSVMLVFLTGFVNYCPSNLLSKTTKLILLDSLLQEVVVTLPHLVLQKPSTAKMREAPTGTGTDTG